MISGGEADGECGQGRSGWRGQWDREEGLPSHRSAGVALQERLCGPLLRPGRCPRYQVLFVCYLVRSLQQPCELDADTLISEMREHTEVS